ncbi:hypothetical protein AGMMS49928_19250 [Spirochaetia bacterium]|nr:hypothetical protein AGMMS49928_19250 [Spirochaetia bacterium]
MEDLFGNLYVLIPIAVVIALRIIGSRKQSADNRAENRTEKQAPPVYKPPVYIYEEGDDDEPIRRVETIVIPEHAGEAFPAVESVFQAIEPLVSSPKPGFPQNLDCLPPLQRAFALTEILGPPKALQ